MFDLSMANEPSGFEPLKFYCMLFELCLRFWFSNSTVPGLSQSKHKKSDQFVLIRMLISIFANAHAQSSLFE